MTSPKPLEFGQYYHIYNRGNNREDVFVEDRNYRHFLRLYAKHVMPVADTQAYCLLRNHFHLLVRIKTVEEQKAYVDPLEVADGARSRKPFRVKRPSRQFGNLFNAYAKAFNKTYGRTGSLFQNPFGRVLVRSDAQLRQAIVYIHRNPQKHGLVADFRAWPYSSYRAILSSKPTHIERYRVLEWFDSAEGFRSAHQRALEEQQVSVVAPDGQTLRVQENP